MLLQVVSIVTTSELERVVSPNIIAVEMCVCVWEVPRRNLDQAFSYAGSHLPQIQTNVDR